jgi:transcriptional regulator with XRE-family HTH domain
LKPFTQLLRAFPVPDAKKKKKGGRRRSSQFSAPREREKTPAAIQREEMEEIKSILGPAAWPWFGPMLIFDCETTTGVGQELRFGMFQERGENYRALVENMRFKGKPTREYMDRPRSEGLFYNPKICSNTEIDAMQSYCDADNLRFLTLEQFLKDVFYKTYYYKRWNEGEPALKLPALVIGHNLPFDLGAISYGAGPSRGEEFYGGLTVKLLEKKPNIAIRKLGFGKHMYQIHQDRNERRNHQFLDTLQLGRALLGPGKNSMRGLLKKLKIKDVEKGEADYEGPITAEYIGYARTDVQATWRIFQELRTLYVKHGRSRPIDRIYSEASVGKSYLDDLGITPFMRRNPNFDRHVIGAFMETLYGGRSGVRIRHKIRETLQADFKSQYPSINTLMKLQDLLIADSVEAIKGGSDSEAGHFLRGVTLADMQNKETWPKLRGVALIKPRSDILPVRTVFNGNENEDGNETNENGDGYPPDSFNPGFDMRAQQIGLNIIESGPPTWYTFADIISSKLLTGKCPEILKTIELVPHGVQKGLKPIAFFGDPEYTIDLYKDDLFKRVIDMRATISKSDPRNLALKLLANAVSYGATIEFIVDEHKDQTGTTVYYSDKDARRVARAAVPSGDGGHEISGYKVERAGKWFAPWGPLIPAGGRLLLAIAERLATDRGLDYVFTDTDAMAFDRPDNMSRADFETRVQEIAGPNGWFQPLNPYSSDDAFFNLEDANYSLESLAANKKDKSKPLVFEPLYVTAVSAKRYALANRGPNGEWIIRKASGHGLGHITAPSYDEITFPIHPAAPFEIKPDTTSPLWFGVKGEWDHGELSKCQAPKLICDLWRIAFEAADRGESIQDAVLDALQKLPGLDKPQFMQRSLASRSDWAEYDHLPNRRAFMFFSTLPAPAWSEAWHKIERQNAPAILAKARDDLFATSLYANVIDGEVDIESLRRFDNNKFPAEIFIERYHLRLTTVADCLDNYFDHPELKSHGHTGVLDRRRMVIIDHEYVGKETNSLVDEEIEDAGEQRKDEAPSIPIFRKGFNPAVLDGLDLKKLADRIGVTENALRDARNVGRRLDADVMTRLQSALNVSGDGRVSIDPTPPFTPEAKRARRMAKQLRALHDAIAAGKDFDLNGQRRSALLNQWRGPATFDQIRIAVERHLTDKTARRFFMDRIGVFWRGDAAMYVQKNARELGLIDDAIAIASGAKRPQAVRQVRDGAASKTLSLEERATANKLRAEKAKRDRIARKTEAGNGFAKTPGGGWRGATHGFKACEAFLRAETPDEYADAIKTLVAGSIGFPVHPFRQETRSALKAAARRGSADTAWDQFRSILKKRIADRMTCDKVNRLRMSLARSENKRDHSAGRAVNHAARRSAIGDDGSH